MPCRRRSRWHAVSLSFSPLLPYPFLKGDKVNCVPRRIIVLADTKPHSFSLPAWHSPSRYLHASRYLSPN